MRPTAIRQDIKAETLRRAAKREKNSGVVRRLLGIAHLIEGGSRSEAQEIACLCLSNFRIWIERFNAYGIEGLRAKKSTGRPAKLTDEMINDLKEKVRQGPSIEEGLARYRIVDLQNFLEKKHKVSLGISGIWYILKDLNLSWKTGRQRHPKSDKEVQEAFKKTFQSS
jgi:transposase